MEGIEEYPVASTSKLPPPPPSASSSAVPSSRPARKRRSTIKPDDSPPPTTHSRTSGNNSKLKLKIKNSQNERMDANSVGFDRELDSDPDEPLAIEEHFILRVPPNLAPKLHEAVSKREVLDSTWFKFKDSRRAVFHFENKLFGAKLVDLPTLIESQKMTGTGGHSIKVADISQMLIVEDEVDDEGQVTRERAFNIEDFIYPHGITPPLKHVRKRRFRKRVNKRTIEIVEDAVEKLLEADATCEESKYELIDHEGSDDDDYNSDNDRRGQSIGAQDSVGAPTPRGDDLDADGMDEGEEDGEGEDDEEEGEGSGYDSDLADEINRGMQAQDASASEEEINGKKGEGSDDSDGDGLFGGSSDEEEEEEEEQDDPETLEERRRIKLLAEEVGDLERAISVKEADMAKATNPIFKKRFEEVIKKLSVDRDAKKAQHLTATREMEKKKEATAAAVVAANLPTLVIPTPVVINPTPAKEVSEVDAMDVDQI